MINIVFLKHKDNIIGFEAKGHANFDIKGKDIVCSAVSSIIIGGLNAINNISNFEVKIQNGYVKCLSNSKIDTHDQIVIETIEVQLRTIQDSFGDFVKIEERNESYGTKI